MSREVLHAIGLLLIGKVWPSAAVPGLVGMLGNSNEDGAETAYMALVKIGVKALPQLLEEAHCGHQVASVLQVIGDLGNPEAIPELEKYLTSADSQVAAAAADSISSLQ